MTNYNYVWLLNPAPCTTNLCWRSELGHYTPSGMHTYSISWQTCKPWYQHNLVFISFMVMVAFTEVHVCCLYIFIMVIIYTITLMSRLISILLIRSSITSTSFTFLH